MAVAFRAAVGFQKDSKWMFTASEDGFVKVWDVRARGCQREYESRAPINTAVLHPNQGELITGAPLAHSSTAAHAAPRQD